MKRLEKRFIKSNHLLFSKRLPSTLRVYPKEKWLIIPIDKNFNFVDFVRFYGNLANPVFREWYSASSLFVGLHPEDQSHSFYLRPVSRSILIGRVNSGKKFFTDLTTYSIDTNIPDDAVILSDEIGLPDMSVEYLLRSVNFNLFWLTYLEEQESFEIQVRF
ncbi:MAG: hypothetical protein GWN30_10375 [Gammaproteobacteria bacterium]|nr:hypothetical protein [Gammaproteobacteria bacterium]NIW96818.1 hypothetical protein [Phycisphaerae bacterium]